MASFIRSSSILKISNGFRRSWTTNILRYNALKLQRYEAAFLHTTVTRSLAAQRPIENARGGGRTRALGVDKALYRIDTEMRKTGRIYIRDIQDIFGEIKYTKHASSTQSLLLLRCCGSLVPEERPDVRNKLVQEIWDTLHQLNVPLDVSHYNTLLRVYLENNHKFSATEFLADLEKNGIEPNRVTYQRLIARYCQDGDIEGATKILEFMKEKQLPVGENIFTSLIMGHARADDLESSHGVLEVMRASGLEPNSETYTALLCGYAEAEKLDAIEKTLEETKAAEVALHDRDIMEVILLLAQKGHAVYVMQLIERLEKQHGYNQDAINLIYRLLNSGCSQMAYQVFLSMQTSRNAHRESAPMGSFFICHLVRCGMDIPTLVHYCQEVKKEGFNLFALETALGTALNEGYPEMALALLEVMAEDNVEIRSHYFWPIISHYGRLGDYENVYKTVGVMARLKVAFTLDTFRTYVIPAVVGQGEEAVVSGLREAGMSFPMIVNSLVAFHLDDNNLQEAARVVTKYRTGVKDHLRRTLANVYLNFGDAKAATAVLGQMLYLNQDLVADVSEEKEVEEDEGGKEEEESQESRAGERKQLDIAGIFLLDFLTQLQRRRVEGRVEPLLQEMSARGIGISNPSATLARGRLSSEEATETVLALLETLSSGDIVYQPLQNISRESYSQQSVEELETRLEEMRTSNKPTMSVEINLLMGLVRRGDVQKAEEVMKSLESQQFPFNMGIYAMLIDMYVRAEQLGRAQELLAQFSQRHPDARLTPSKFLRLAQLMAQQGLINEAVELIKTHGPENPFKQQQQQVDPFISNNLSRSVLDVLAEKGDLTSTRLVLDALLSSQVVSPSNTLFGPLIKAHMVNDDLDGALEEFEKICREHRCTPLKSELTSKFIALEDGPRLQKVLDLSIEVHGEVNSLYDMVIVFIEADRINQAKKLINTPGLRANNNKLDRVCQRFSNMGQITYLENLIAITKNVFDVDREMMYTHLLQVYKGQGDTAKALDIWTTMQEENLEPSESFLYELGTFLESNGQKTPFIVPEKLQAPIKVTAETPVSQLPQVTKQQLSAKELFHLAVKNRDFTTSLELRKEIEESGVQLSIRELSDLVEGLVQKNMLGDAAGVTREMLVAGVYPMLHVFKFLLLALSRVGDVQNLTLYEKYIDEGLKKKVSFNNRLCDSYRAAGRWREVVEDLRTRLKTTQESELPLLISQFPKGSIMGILEDEADSLELVTSLSEEYGARGLMEPANCLWMHHFCKDEHSQAEEIYKNYLSEGSRLMFGGILNQAKRQLKPELVEKLMGTIGSHPSLTPQAKGFIYTTWIDIHGDMEEYSKGQKVLELALSSITLDSLGHSTLTKLKAGIEGSGTTFPYTIPPKNVRARKQNKAQSSSSSSSDSD